MLRVLRVVGRDDTALEGSHARDTPDREVFELLSRDDTGGPDGVSLDDGPLVLDDHGFQALAVEVEVEFAGVAAVDGDVLVRTGW